MSTRKKTAIIWIQRILVMVGIVALGYCGFVISEARRYQSRAQELLQEPAAEIKAPAGSIVGDQNVVSEQDDGVERPERRADKDALLGKLEIPSLGISAMVADGTSPKMLRVAVGHVSGTARPGERGNIALAAHRDTFFRGLGEIKAGDEIRFKGRDREYVYKVSGTVIVDPDQTWVLRKTSKETLTLITCYPFHYIGSAPKRFIVRASRVG